MWPRHGFWGKLPSVCPFPLRLPAFAVLKNYNPDPQLLSKYVIRANVTATKFVCLEKSRLPATWASQTLSGEMSPNSAICGLEYHKLYGNSIILGQNPSSGYFSPKGRAKYFSRKIYFLDNTYLVKMSQVRLVLWSSLLVDSLHFLENVPE